MYGPDQRLRERLVDFEVRRLEQRRLLERRQPARPSAPTPARPAADTGRPGHGAAQR